MVSTTRPRTSRRRSLPIPGWEQVQARRLGLRFSILMLLGAITWSYWPALTYLWDTWQASEDYSAGQLVPLVAVFFVWRERKTLAKLPLAPRWFPGIALVLLAETAGIYLFLAGAHPSVERYLILLMIAGLVLLIAGRQVFRRVLWILLFLFLMFPLPGQVHNLIAGPLQQMATTGSVVLLEAMGTPVSQQGNVIVLGDNMPIAVAEACSGLRMLTAFIIVAAFIAYMVRRPRWQKSVLLVSSIPVAVVSNIVRIFATAVLMLYVSREVGSKFFHDFAGLVMMPVAVLLLFGELWLMNKLIVPESAAGPRPKDILVRSAPSRRQTPAMVARECQDLQDPLPVFSSKKRQRARRCRS